MLPRRWRTLAPNLGQGSPLQELLRINHRSRLPDGQDFVCRDPMVTDVLPEKQVLQRILHHGSRLLDIHQSLPLMSRRRHQDVLLARIRAAQLCLCRAGYHTSHHPGDVGGISGNSPCSEQEPAQWAFSGGKQTRQLFYQITSDLCRTGLLQHIRMRFISSPFLPALTGSNTMVHTLIFSWPLGQLCTIRSTCFGTGWTLEPSSWEIIQNWDLKVHLEIQVELFLLQLKAKLLPLETPHPCHLLLEIPGYTTVT